MMILGREIAAKVIGMVVAGIVIFAILIFGISQCDKRRDQAAQSRVERSQGEAASNSAADAIATVTRSGEASRASEELTRANERDIRSAEGANEQVGAGVNAAGMKALCKRAAYRDTPRCKALRGEK